MKKKILAFLAIVVLLTAMAMLVFTDANKKDVNNLEYGKQLTRVVNKSNYDLEDKINIESIIKQYYDISYESYFTLELQDMSKSIDVNSLWAKNYMIVMEENIETIKYAKQKNYDITQTKKIPINIEIMSIFVDEDTAEVTVNIDGIKDESYPLFVCFDKNVFKLRKVKEGWKILSVSNDDVLFRMLNETEFKPIDKNKLHETIDNDFL